MQIARPINLLPSLLLVVIGALTGSKGRALLTLRSAAVWIVSVISGGVAVASVSVNDYFGGANAYVQTADVMRLASEPCWAADGLRPWWHAGPAAAFVAGWLATPVMEK